MGITDKVSGKTKQVVGDLTGNPETRREGKQEERKGEKKEELHRAAGARRREGRGGRGPGAQDLTEQLVSVTERGTRSGPSLVPGRRRRSEARAA